MNNQSDKPEKLKPQDSERKDIKHPKDDNQAVVKPEDKDYNEEEAEFKNVAKARENSEQPVNPIKQAPKE
ncbi:MAG: hypothetical protein JWN56_1398 [Sphingobacteriales bacterium]|nr:hypothetical protein [Sphingobacteriales bacterium]